MTQEHSHSVDRRVARTRAALQDALISLVLEKGYDPITIKDICDAANVGRATFYAHYKSKDDLKRSGLTHLRKLLIRRQREPAGNLSLAFSLRMFEHARDHLKLYRALIGSRGGAMALGTIREIVADLVRADLAGTSENAVEKKSVGDIPRDLMVQYIVGAFMALLTGWLDGGAKLPPARIDEAFRRLTVGALAAVTGSKR